MVKNLGLSENIEKKDLAFKFNSFLNNKHNSSKKSNLISIHVGASRQNKIAPDTFWAELLSKLCNHKTMKSLLLDSKMRFLVFKSYLAEQLMLKMLALFLAAFQSV